MDDKIQYPGLVEIKKESKIQDSEWYQYVKEYRPQRFAEGIVNFYPDFDKEKHFIPEDQLYRHRLVYDHFWWVLYHHPELV